MGPQHGLSCSGDVAGEEGLRSSQLSAREIRGGDRFPQGARDQQDRNSRCFDNGHAGFDRRVILFRYHFDHSDKSIGLCHGRVLSGRSGRDAREAGRRRIHGHMERRAVAVSAFCIQASGVLAEDTRGIPSRRRHDRFKADVRRIGTQASAERRRENQSRKDPGTHPVHRGRRRCTVGYVQIHPQDGGPPRGADA